MLAGEGDCFSDYSGLRHVQGEASIDIVSLQVCFLPFSLKRLTVKQPCILDTALSTKEAWLMPSGRVFCGLSSQIIVIQLNSVIDLTWFLYPSLFVSAKVIICISFVLCVRRGQIQSINPLWCCLVRLFIRHGDWALGCITLQCKN